MCGTCGSINCQGCNPMILPEGIPGMDGWSPEFAVVTDGPTRCVLQLIAWFGGSGTTPSDFINQYVGPSGYTTIIGDATNIRGTDGANADAFVDVIGTPDQSIAYSDGVTPAIISGTLVIGIDAGTYNIQLDAIYSCTESTATGKFGLYHGAVLIPTAYPVGPHPAAAKHSISMHANNVVIASFVDSFSVRLIETTVATHMNLFTFKLSYQKIA